MMRALILSTALALLAWGAKGQQTPPPQPAPAPPSAPAPVGPGAPGAQPVPGPQMMAPALPWMELFRGKQAPPEAPSPHENTKIRVGINGMRLSISRKAEPAVQDSLLRDLGLSGGRREADSLWNLDREPVACGEGWSLVKRSRKAYVLEKDLAFLGEGLDKFASPLFLLDESWMEFQGPMHTLFPEANYGINLFKEKMTVQVLPDGRTRFFLPGHADAGRVVLSGSFNNWNTQRPLMAPTDSGWVAVVDLAPGKHLYKFIVDGQWIYDEQNRLKESDGLRGYNSVYFRYNHRFFLPGYPQARSVYVAGSFNNWSTTELPLTRWMGGWVIEVYVREGMHRYKFYVDKEWVLDPRNPDVRPDQSGYMNNYFGIGKPLSFSLRGFEQASHVQLCGDFNDWNEWDTPMRRVIGGWQADYVSGPGNFGYKFIVDGVWMHDPDNPHTDGDDPYRNSIRVVEPNHRFRLNGYANAERVLLSGTFNDWSTSGYTMARDSEGWYMDVHLKPGKHRYKFVVDGEWILDPDNPLWEQNEVGTGNSVVWVEAVTEPQP